MAKQQVQATINVQSENFHEILEESILDSSTTDQSSSYEQLIAANERLKMKISKIFTEFVNKARLEQQANGDEKKRKIKHDEEEEEEEEVEDEEEDAGSSDDNNEEEQ